MLKHTALVAAIGVFACWRTASAQEPTVIDFGRDVQPLFKAHCIDCQGPNEQKNGFRLDRRQDALRGGLGESNQCRAGVGNKVKETPAQHSVVALVSA